MSWNFWCSLRTKSTTYLCTRLHSKRIVWFSLNWMSITLNLRSVVLFQSNQNSAHNSNQSKWIHMSSQPTCLDSKTVRFALCYHVPVNENPLHGPIWLISSVCNNVCVFLLLSGSLVAAILVWISLKYFVLCSMSCNTYEYEEKKWNKTQKMWVMNEILLFFVD